LNEVLVAGVERAVKSCPAYGTLVHAPSVEVAIEAAPGHVATADARIG
jgi:hypothetical protein